jgi:hypothetical protein
MWALKVTRPTTAAARRESVKVLHHSEKRALEAPAMEARSSLAVMIWNSSPAPRGFQGQVADLVEADQVEAGVAAEDAGEFVGGFGEFVD